MSDRELLSRERVRYERQLEGVTIDERTVIGGLLLDDIVRIALDKAADLALGAAMGGAHHDGGAQDLVNQLKAFLAGINREMFSCRHMDEALKQHTRDTDPEYAEYERLKKKFGD